jgi:hypothetical protein
VHFSGWFEIFLDPFKIFLEVLNSPCSHAEKQKQKGKTRWDFSHFFVKHFLHGLLWRFSTPLAEKRQKIQLNKSGQKKTEVSGCFLDEFCTCMWAGVRLFSSAPQPSVRAWALFCCVMLVSAVKFFFSLQ